MSAGPRGAGNVLSPQTLAWPVSCRCGGQRGHPPEPQPGAPAGERAHPVSCRGTQGHPLSMKPLAKLTFVTERPGSSKLLRAEGGTASACGSYMCERVQLT